MKKRVTNKKTLIIAPILFLGIVLPRIVSAISLPKMAEHAGIAILQAIGKLLTKLFSWLIDLAADFFESMLTVGFKGQQDIAKIGWDVTRDFANMLFILFMVVIAFATILRFERYGVKELLPKLILIALLINFSMVICYVIIDFTNIVADFFISDAKKGIPGSRDLTISAILADSFKLPDLYIPMVCDRYLIDLDDCYNLQTISESTRNNCIQQAEDGLNRCYAETENEKTEEDDFLDVIVATIGSSAILMIAAFVLFAGGILLVVRMVTIWFLVMIAPLAFICYILPALRRNWESWWSQFIRWCLFAPAYSFFIWLACKISIEQKLSNISALSQSVSLRSPQAINAFFASTGNILNFLFIVGLLIGGLLAANQLGIKGAGTAMMIGKKMARGARDRIKRPILDYGKGARQEVGGLLRRGVGAGLQHIPGLKKLGAVMETRGKIQQAKPTTTKKAQERKEIIANMTHQQRAMMMEGKTTMTSANALSVVTTMMEKGDFKKDSTSTKATRNAISTLRAYGRTKEAEDLENSRSDTIQVRGAGLGGQFVDPVKTREAQKAKVLELHKKGKLGEVLPSSFNQGANSTGAIDGLTDKSIPVQDAQRYANADRDHRIAASKAFEQRADFSERTRETEKQYITDPATGERQLNPNYDPNNENRRLKEVYASLNIENTDDIEDPDKKYAIGEYAATHNRLDKLSEGAKSDEAVMRGVLDSASLSTLRNWAKSSQSMGDAIEKMSRTLLTSSRSSVRTQNKSLLSLATISKSLKGLNSNQIASFVEEAGPEEMDGIKNDVIGTGTGQLPIKDVVKAFVSGAKNGNKTFVSVLKKTGKTIADDIAKEIRSRASTSPEYTTILREIELDKDTKNLGLDPTNP